MRSPSGKTLPNCASKPARGRRHSSPPASTPSGRSVIYQIAWLIGLLALGLALLYFPTGALPSKRWRWVPLLMGLALLVLICSLSYFEWGLSLQQLQLGDEAITDPLAPIIRGVGFLSALASVAGAVASFFARLRSAHGVERQQIKWFSLSIALYLVFALVQLVPPLFIQMKTDLISAVVGEAADKDK